MQTLTLNGILQILINQHKINFSNYATRLYKLKCSIVKLILTHDIITGKMSR